MINERRKIFFDAEFCDLDTDVHFLSLAFVTDKGKELYLEIQQPNWRISNWVDENVVVNLKNKEKYSEQDAAKIIRDFIERNYLEDPILVADVNQFDWIGICKLFGVWDIPFFYIPIDFSTILYCCGIDYNIDRMKLAEDLNVETYGFKKHNALDDAKVMRELYYKITEYYSIEN